MPDHLTIAQRYRERAVECRHLAKLAGLPQAKKDFEKLASYYDQLAQEEAGRRGASPSGVGSGLRSRSSRTGPKNGLLHQVPVRLDHFWVFGE
jgi:hypothetical protein